MRRFLTQALLLSLCTICTAQEVAPAPSPAQQGEQSPTAMEQRFVPMRRRRAHRTPQASRPAQMQASGSGQVADQVPPALHDVARQVGLAGSQLSPAQPPTPASALDPPTPRAHPQGQSQPATQAQSLVPPPQPAGSKVEDVAAEDPPFVEQLAPPVPPTVTYENGLLSISAENSTLASILDGLRTHVGEEIDVPAASQMERVAVHLGPASPREVLASLLSGSKFNYVIVGSVEAPGTVQRLILTPRQDPRRSLPIPDVHQQTRDVPR